MNRILKFRAWDKVLKLMSKGIPFLWFITGNDDMEFGEDSPLPFSDLKCNIDDLIFMQFTGLLDKNGKEIYEGDIVKRNRFFAGTEDYVGTVVFVDGCFIIEPEITIIHEYVFNACHVEVIGNVFENPDLIHK